MQLCALGLSGSLLLPAPARAFNRPDADAYYKKLRDFDSPSADDIRMSPQQLATARACLNRLQRIQALIGYGNFNVISFDAALKITRNYPQVGTFSTAELELLEQTFYENAATYGFYGDKVLTEITASIPKKETFKVPGSGHFLFKGESLAAFNKIRRDIGDSLILTSGIRGIVKQMYLFLDKTLRSEGNLSQASRSLAPPGYSYHAISDFDVGKRGWGVANFSQEFATTDEYRRLMDLGYVRLRYSHGNPYGVRYEPWHITVIQG